MTRYWPLLALLFLLSGPQLFQVYECEEKPNPDGTVSLVNCQYLGTITPDELCEAAAQTNKTPET